MQRGMDGLSRDMQRAYEKEDWDRMEQYLIDEIKSYLKTEPGGTRKKTAEKYVEELERQ